MKDRKKSKKREDKLSKDGDGDISLDALLQDELEAEKERETGESEQENDKDGKENEEEGKDQVVKEEREKEENNQEKEIDKELHDDSCEPLMELMHILYGSTNIPSKEDAFWGLCR